MGLVQLRGVVFFGFCFRYTEIDGTSICIIDQ